MMQRLFCVLAVCASLGACSSMSKEQIGTATGAAVGGAAGKAMGGGTLGTLGGAAAGAVIGNEVGKRQDAR